jgi:(p)ppGpp synthase/HD superfamily hydrolase
MSRIDAAVTFAAQCHAGQVRKESRLPYIIHPLEVMKRLERWGIDEEDMLVAAACHDVIEDCPKFDESDVRAVIGDRATGFVLELTRVVHPRNGISVDEQKSAYLESWTASKSVESLVIKIADRICNTADFVVQRPDYAPKYWAKALPLWGALDLRDEEIAIRFGHGVAHSIIIDAESMAESLNPVAF